MPFPDTYPDLGITAAEAADVRAPETWHTLQDNITLPVMNAYPEARVISKPGLVNFTQQVLADLIHEVGDNRDPFAGPITAVIHINPTQDIVAFVVTQGTPAGTAAE